MKIVQFMLVLLPCGFQVKQVRRKFIHKRVSEAVYTVCSVLIQMNKLQTLICQIKFFKDISIVSSDPIFAQQVSDCSVTLLACVLPAKIDIII